MGFDGFPSKPGDNPALDIIEELRAELAAMTRAYENMHADYAKAANERDQARAELAAEREGRQECLDEIKRLDYFNAKLREALEMSREAISDAREFTATALAKIGDGHRIGELVADWDYAAKRIDAVLKELGGGDGG